MEEQCPVWEYLDAGEALVAAAKWSEAFILYQEGIKRYPDCPELHRALGFVQEQLEDRLGQRSSYQRSIELDPEQPNWVYGTLGYLLLEQQQWLEAIKVYRRGLIWYPGQADFYRNIGFAQEQIGEIAGEIESYRQAIELGRQPDWVYMTLVELLVRQGNVVEAIAIGQLGVEQYPELLTLQQRIIELEQRQAEQHGITITPRLEPPEPQEQVVLETYIEQAQQFTQQERFQEAIEVYRAAIDKYPDEVPLLVELGMVQEQLGRISDMLVSYQAAIERDLNQPAWVFSTVAYWMIQQENFKAAISVAEQMIELYPAEVAGYEKLADALALNAKHDQTRAVEMYQKAIALSPDKIENYYKVLGIRPKHTQTYWLISHVLEKQNEHERAAFLKGIAQGRKAEHPFDWEFYTDIHPDLSHLSTYEEAYSHWIQFGQAEGRPGSIEDLYRCKETGESLLPEDFNYREYLEINSDLKASCQHNEHKAIAHYVRFGRKEGRKYSAKQLYFDRENLALTKNTGATRPLPTASKIAAFVVIQSLETWQHYQKKLSAIADQLDTLIMGVDRAIWTPTIHSQLRQEFCKSQILIINDMTIKSFSTLMNQISWDEYEFFVLLHAESQNQGFGFLQSQAESGLTSPINALLASPNKFQANLERMRNDPAIGLLASGGISNSIGIQQDGLDISLVIREGDCLSSFNLIAKPKLLSVLHQKIQTLKYSNAGQFEKFDFAQEDLSTAALQWIQGGQNQKMQFCWQN